MTEQQRKKEYNQKYYRKHKERLKEEKKARYHTARYQDAPRTGAFRDWLRATGTAYGALAEKLGVGKSTICMWQKGVQPVNLETIRAALPELADYLEGAT